MARLCVGGSAGDGRRRRVAGGEGAIVGEAALVEILVEL